jgi:hypothetical protein
MAKRCLALCSDASPLVDRRRLRRSSPVAAVATAVNTRTAAAQSSSFFAPPQPAGNRQVQLQPTNVVNASLPVNEANSFSTAVTARFNTANQRIEVRSAATYPPTTIAWSAGTRYRIRFVVNVAAHTYDAYVTAPGAAERTIGTGLACSTTPRQPD